MAIYYNPMRTTVSTTRAWVEASTRLRAAPGMSLGGLMLHVEHPVALYDEEAEVVSAVDAFLRKHGKHPVATVANTIFPASLDRGDGIAGLRERYLPIYRRRMRRQGEWGRYFERMVNWEDRQGRRIDQIAENIRMLRDARQRRFYENRYEIVISDPVRDLRKSTNRQCLSLIELKPERDGPLHMLAVYRNHYYIQRTLGNLLGLARLLEFIARESGFAVGTLTINSTSARIETDGWSKSEVTALINACETRLIRRAA